MSSRRLGKGIDALLQGRDLEQMKSLSSVVSVPVDELVASPHQPRKEFSEQALKELADSIREKGVIQPILAERRDDGTCEIIAGERRFRAARLAGLKAVPVLLRSFTEEEKLEIALIENLQRQDLNPIEEAQAYRSLMQSALITQEQLSKRLGLNRSTVANSVRLLNLPETIQHRVASGDVSAGHARALLSIADVALRQRLFEAICDEGISVREAERIAGDIARGLGEAAFAAAAPGSAQADDETAEAEPASGLTPRGSRQAHGSDGHRDARPEVRKSPELHEMEERLLERLGTKVIIIGSDTRGKIQIDYLSMDDLERIYDIIVSKD